MWRDTAAAAEAEITLALASSAALPRIIECRGMPVGYAQAVEIGMWDGSLPRSLPPGTWMTDYFLAAPAADSLDVGSAVLRLLTEEVFATTLAVACAAVVPIRNETAARCYERTGFRWLQVLGEPVFSWLMHLERPGRAP